jgi:hypothetical protein
LALYLPGLTFLVSIEADRPAAAAAAEICSYRSSSSSARQGKRDKYSQETFKNRFRTCRFAVF